MGRTAGRPSWAPPPGTWPTRTASRPRRSNVDLDLVSGIAGRPGAGATGRGWACSGLRADPARVGGRRIRAPVGDQPPGRRRPGVRPGQGRPGAPGPPRLPARRPQHPPPRRGEAAPGEAATTPRSTSSTPAGAKDPELAASGGSWRCSSRCGRTTQPVVSIDVPEEDPPPGQAGRLETRESRCGDGAGRRAGDRGLGTELIAFAAPPRGPAGPLRRSVYRLVAPDRRAGGRRQA